MNPAIKDPDRYFAEPYVLPGNVDGPDSPHHGRGAWTWYTGSAAWLHRVVAEWVLGVRPEWDGLRIDPCLPPGWDRARDGAALARRHLGDRDRARPARRASRSTAPRSTAASIPVRRVRRGPAPATALSSPSLRF